MRCFQGDRAGRHAMERQDGAARRATSNQKSIIQYLVESGARLDARNKLA